MKILFLNLPYHGHVIPTMGLVQELVRAGHQVTCLLPHSWKDQLSGTGADFLDYKTITADSLRQSALTVMKDPRIRENLRRIQEEIARAPGNTGGVKIIEEFYGKP